LIVRVRDSLTSPRADVRGLQTDQPPQPAAGAVHTVKNDRVMKAVPYLPICQGMLPWQPNNVGWNEKVMKANWYHVHSLHVCQVVARLCFATTC